MEREPSRPSSGGATSSRLHAARSVLLAVIVIGSVLAVGTVHLPVLAALSVLVMVALAVSASISTRTIPAPALVLAALGLFSALQAVPLPMSWLRVIAPATADVWNRAGIPLQHDAPSYGSLSLDPGASVVEALKWWTYAGVFAVSASVAGRRGSSFGLALVYGSALVAAVVTIAHGLLGVTRVWGVYTPTFNLSPWHVGPLLNSNNLAGYLNLGALVGLGLMLARRPVAPRWLLAVGVAFAIAVEVTAASRGAVVMLVVGAIALLGLLRFRGEGEAPRFAMPAIAISLLGGVGLSLLGATRQTWIELYSKNVEKLQMASWVRPMIEDFPVFGIGRGAFESVLPAYAPTLDNYVYTHAENFVLQWLSEWGLPVTFAAFGVLAWHLRPTRLGATRGALAAGAFAGVVAVLVQNLVDLALEIPGVVVGVVCVLGSLYGNRAPERVKQRRGSLLPTTVFLALGPFFLGLALWLGWHDVASDRQALRNLYAAHASAPDLRRAIEASIARHPAEPYFPLIGAIVAVEHRDQSPMPWIQRTLERAQVNPRAHLLLAEIMEARGSKPQALFELRLVVEQDIGLGGIAARRAVAWTRDVDELLSTVPNNERAATYARAIGTELARAGDRVTGARIDEAILRIAPDAIEPRERLVNDLLDAMAKKSAPLCEPAVCAKLITQHADALERTHADLSAAARTRASLLLAQGDAIGAEKLLAAACPKVSDAVACAALRVNVAAKIQAPDALDAAQKQYLVATCTTRSECAAGACSVAALRASRGEWGAAVALYGRAIREEPTDERYILLADAASKFGAHAEAVSALSKLSPARKGTPEIQKRIAEERAQSGGMELMPPPR